MLIEGRSGDARPGGDLRDLQLVVSPLQHQIEEGLHDGAPGVARPWIRFRKIVRVHLRPGPVFVPTPDIRPWSVRDIGPAAPQDHSPVQHTWGGRAAPSTLFVR